MKTIQRVIDKPFKDKEGNVRSQNPRLLDPDGKGGLTETPCTAEDVAKRILTDLDAFVGRAKVIAKHKLIPSESELGTYTLANAPIHVAHQEGRALVTGLANIPQGQVADVLTALDAQLGPTLPIVPSDNPAPLVQNLIQARNAQAEAHTLANPAPESQASNPPSLQTSAAGGSAASRTIVPPERIVGGVRVLTTSVYPMRGQVVGRLGPLGGADGSPARAFGRKPLTTFDLALLYRDLTGGELPTVVHNRAQMGKALGRYYVGQNKIRIAAQIFGLIDESDIRALHDTLAKRGFFLHERPEWAATKTKKQLQAQAEVSEKALERELQKLLKRRIRSGAEPGLPAPKVLAHELWHLIDDQDGGLLGRGNLVGHLAALKRYTAEAFPVAGFAGNTELKAEAKAFITWWRGIGKDEPYFDKPEEMYAEIGAAYFCAPAVLQERAPNCFAAWDRAIRNHPRAAKAYDDACAYIAGGGRPDLIHKTLGETWGREHDRALRELNRAVQGFDNSITAWKRRIVAALWDDRGPALDLVRKAYKERLAEIQEVRRKGGASDLALKHQERRLRAILDKTRLSHVLYRRKGPNNARLYLADIKGEFLERLTDIDPNPDIARMQVERYAHYHRVIELGGRATAYGLDPVQARNQLAQMVKNLGVDKFRMVVRAWNIFRALYERDVIERPATTELLGKDFVDLMRKNTHYVTTKHTVTPERLQALLDGILLSMVQLRKLDYNESEWRTLFARYNLDFDDIPASESLLLKGAKLPARAIAAYWNGAGALSELASATVKLAAYCYLHQDALRPGAITVIRALETALYAPTPTPDFDSIKARASSSLTRFHGSRATEAYSSSDISSLKSLEPALQRAYPPSVDSNATPRDSQTKNAIANPLFTQTNTTPAPKVKPADLTPTQLEVAPQGRRPIGSICPIGPIASPGAFRSGTSAGRAIAGAGGAHPLPGRGAAPHTLQSSLFHPPFSFPFLPLAFLLRLRGKRPQARALSPAETAQREVGPFGAVR